MKLGKRKYQKTQHFPSKVKYFINVKSIKPIDLGIQVPQKKVLNFSQEGIQPLGNVGQMIQVLLRWRTGWETPNQRKIYSKEENKKNTKNYSIFDDFMQQYTVDNNIQEIDIDQIQFLKINDDD